MAININGTSGISGVDGSAGTPALQGSDTNTGISFGADTVNINTGGTTRATVDSSGRFGIGTTSAGTNLSIGASASGGYNGGVYLNRGASSYNFYEASDGTNTVIFGLDNTLSNAKIGSINSYPIGFYTGNVERARIDSSGRLLVGTSSAFDTANTGTSWLVGIEKPSGYSALSIKTNEASSNGAYLNLGKSRGATANSKTIVNNNDELGGVYFEGADGAAMLVGARVAAFVDGTPGANDLPTRLVFSTTADGASSPTERMRIDKDGVLNCPGVYNFTTASAANVVISSGGNFNRSTSSSKYKTDIETLQDSYADALLQCRPVWYRSTCEQDNPAWGWWGFIAEEVAEIDPRLVSWKTTEISYDENGAVVQTPLETPEPEGVQYDRFVPHLLNLIKRQQQAIEILEAKVAALESA